MKEASPHVEFWHLEGIRPDVCRRLTNMRAWLDRAAAEGNEALLIEARLAPNMRPFAAQYQMASDSAKNALARLTGTEAPSMPDTESSFAELQARCDRTIDYRRIENVHERCRHDPDRQQRSVARVERRLVPR